MTPQLSFESCFPATRVDLGFDLVAVRVPGIPAAVVSSGACRGGVDLPGARVSAGGVRGDIHVPVEGLSHPGISSHGEDDVQGKSGPAPASERPGCTHSASESEHTGCRWRTARRRRKQLSVAITAFAGSDSRAATRSELSALSEDPDILTFAGDALAEVELITTPVPAGSAKAVTAASEPKPSAARQVTAKARTPPRFYGERCAMRFVSRGADITGAVSSVGGATSLMNLSRPAPGSPSPTHGASLRIGPDIINGCLPIGY